MLDEKGTVVRKFFEKSYRQRASADFLLSELDASGPPAVYRSSVGDRHGVSMALSVAKLSYRPMQNMVLNLDIDLPNGTHLYTPPTPPAYEALSVELRPHPRVHGFPVEIPRGEPFAIDGLDERFFVLHGETRLAIPFQTASRKHFLDGRARPSPLSEEWITLTVAVRYQVCTERECFPPSERRLAVALREEPLER